MDDTQPAILAIGTAVPQYRINQHVFGTFVGEALDAPAPLRRWLKRLYEVSGIDTRYSCLPEAESFDRTSRFSPQLSVEESATTTERMAIYQREAVNVGVAASEQAIADLGPNTATTITHLIVVSCTGFFAPGLDLVIAQRLGLQSTVKRTLIGFMGCAAAFNGLRLASQIVDGQPDARVLVVCVELCTLHIQAGTDRINLTVASLFADGAAACIVGAPDHQPHFALNRFHTDVYPNSDDAMAWRIGNHGFEMNLSSAVPRYVGAVAAPAVATLGADLPAPTFWAVHPGGRAILDKFAEALGLNDAEMAASYGVLRKYGNMSSPTIMFVLKALFDQFQNSDQDNTVHGVATAFGPGLVVEMAHITYQPAAELALADGRESDEYHIVAAYAA